MAKTDDFIQCQQYLDASIKSLDEQLHECQLELIKQAASFAMPQLSLNQIEHELKAFVDSQRRYLSIRHDEQLNKFNAHRHDRTMLPTLSDHNLTREQVGLTHLPLIDAYLFTLYRWILFDD